MSFLILKTQNTNIKLALISDGVNNSNVYLNDVTRLCALTSFNHV